MNYKKAVAGVAAGATLLGGTVLIAVPALAQDDSSDPSTDDSAAVTPKAFRDGSKFTTLADALGIDTTELRDRLEAGETVAGIAAAEGVDIDTVVDVLVAAAEERLATAVSDERITQDRADERLAEVEERITAMVNGEVPFGLRNGFRGFGGFGPFGIDAVAEALGLETADLAEQLRSGDTLADVAAAQGVPIEDVTAAISTAMSERLDEAVADDRLTQEQADEMLGGLTDRIDDIVNGEAPLGGRGFGPGGHRGFGPDGEAGFGGFGPGRSGPAADTSDA